MSGPIHVVLAFDDNFWAPAYATMRGICLSSRRKGDLVFHLFHLKLRPERLPVLRRIESEFGAGLHDVALDDEPAFRELLTHLPKGSGGLREIAYSRLLADEFLPPEATRFIYADCDLLFKAPIERLYEIDIQGKALAAVLDIYGLRHMGKRNLRQNRDVFDTADPYFNSGMMVIDRAGWRGADPLAVLRRFSGQDRLRRLFHDQGVLNIAFKNKWLILDSRWNYLDPTGPALSLDPHVLHYTGKLKPWLRRSPVAYARHYLRVMTRPVFTQYQREIRCRYWAGIGNRLMGRQ